MIKILKASLLGGAIVLMVQQAAAFSLAGPLPPWQTTRIGYIPIGPNLPNVGVMNLNEEYRWNAQGRFYGYSSQFLTYFGESGASAIDEAVGIINSLPAMDNLDVDDYPLESLRMNSRASALGLTDIKSVALSNLMLSYGLTDPGRYVYTLRNRYVINNVVYFHTTKRNFDPITWQPSSYINGELWTYSTIIDGDTTSYNLNVPVDPLALVGLRRLPAAAWPIVWTPLPDGAFRTGLTRDDVGGLKYIYRSANYNTERMIGNVSGGGGGLVPGVGGGDGPYDFPGLTTPGDSPYDFPFLVVTNIPAQTPGGGQLPPPGQLPGGGAALTNFVDPVLRGGVNTLTLSRANYDSLLGVFFDPFTVQFTDSYVTNGNTRTQRLTRNVVQPDIIFDAADLQGGDGTQVVLFQSSSNAGNWDNSDDLDGNTGDDFGPGVIAPPFTITFNSVGPLHWNSVALGGLSEFVSQDISVIWASFDGTTNEPVIYPVGTSIIDIERLAFGR